MQAGTVYHLNTGRDHAALWHGTAESFVDINPSWSAASDILATDGQFFAGWAIPGSTANAGVWLSDDPASYVDLHHLLGPGYVASGAAGVSAQGDHIYVVGTATPSAGPAEAWLWVGTVPTPGTGAALLLGLGSFSKRRRR